VLPNQIINNTTYTPDYTVSRVTTGAGGTGADLGVRRVTVNMDWTEVAQ